MKYTFLINQAGIVDAGFAETTDFNDWAILEYVADWQIHGSACKADDHVWLNYAYLLNEIPLLSVRSKSGLSERIKKLREFGLLSTFQSDDSRLFVKVTDRYSTVVRFRGVPTVTQSGHSDEHPVRSDEHPVRSDEDPVRSDEHPVRSDEHPVRSDEHPVRSDEHTINNQNKLSRINNQNNTELLGESYPQDKIFNDPLQWAQFFIRQCHYPLHIVQTAKTIPLFSQWVSDRVCVGDIQQAMAACHGWNGDRVPDSPVLYGRFLDSILDARRRLAEAKVFDRRSGEGRGRRVEDWAKVPRDDDALWPWAKKHGYVGPGTMTYRQYRSRLNAQVEQRLSDDGG